MSSDLVYAQREIDNLINLLADARTENMKLNEYIKRQAMDILLCKSGNDTLYEENTRLRAALDLYRDAVRIDATMEGPKFMGANSSALKRAWDADRAALEGK